MTAEPMTVYGVTLYHDEPGEANVDQRDTPGYWPLEEGARAAAKRALTDYWNSASVYVGTLIPANLPHYPERLVDDATTRYIGPTWDEPA